MRHEQRDADKPGSATSTRTPSPVEVEIRGTRLVLRSDRDPEYVRRLAAYVDEQLGALARAAPNVPGQKRLLMACLTLAEELFEERRNAADRAQEIDERLGTLLAWIEDEAARE